jgi:hypothetical protein
LKDRYYPFLENICNRYGDGTYVKILDKRDKHPRYYPDVITLKTAIALGNLSSSCVTMACSQETLASLDPILNPHISELLTTIFNSIGSMGHSFADLGVQMLHGAWTDFLVS